MIDLKDQQRLNELFALTIEALAVPRHTQSSESRDVLARALESAFYVGGFAATTRHTSAAVRLANLNGRPRTGSDADLDWVRGYLRAVDQITETMVDDSAETRREIAKTNPLNHSLVD